MDLQRRLDELLRVAAGLGLSVRRVPLGGDGGGYCVVRGERRLFVDTLADLETQYEHTLAALAGLPELADVYLTPEVREDIDRISTANNAGQDS